jgi:hypothetical protein
MSNINLDINTYSINEMENLLKLKHPYIQEDVFNAKNKMESNIIKSNITEVKKEELLIFLDNIYNKLTNNLVKIDAKNFNDVKQFDGNHFIIKNENDKYSSTLENNKQINKSIIKRTYTIDSLFRQNYDSDDNQSHNYTITLPETINKAITMSMTSLEIPLTYHNISEELNNNCFKVEILYANTKQIVDPSFSLLIQLTTGLYESRYTGALTSSQIKASNIKSEIESKIKNSFSLLSQDLSKNGADSSNVNLAIDLCNNLTFGIDIRAGFGVFQYDISNTPNFFDNYSIKIDFDVNNNEKIINQITGKETSSSCYQNEIYQKLGWQLGFRTKNIILSRNSINSGNLYKEISRGICYINYPRYLYVAIDDFQSSSRNYFSIAAESIIAPNIIGRINILSLLEEKTPFKQAAAPGDFNYNNKHVREYFGPTDINKLKISLLDEYGRPFTLNNMDWSFVLSFECFYN